MADSLRPSIVLVVALTLYASASAEDDESEHSTAQRRDHVLQLADAGGQVATSPAPVYQPPPGLGAPQTRVGGGTRGASAELILSVLAPDHVGLTTHEAPTLYWYASVPVERPVALTVIDEESIEPLLELRLSPPVAAGIHALSLAEHGFELATGKEYQWFVAAIVDPAQRSRDILAGGYVKRVEAPPGLAEALSAAPSRERPRVYAEAGIWYDAIEGLSRLIEQRPDQRLLSSHRNALLEQIDLAHVAAYERGRSRP